MNFEAKGYWNYWRGQENLFGKTMSIEPHRFLSMECVIFEAEIMGELEGACLRLSPELESMSYIDPYGNIYRYEDDLGYKVHFPLRLKRIKVEGEKSTWQIEYYLPYAPSTKDEADKRLRGSYKATLYVYPKGSQVGAGTGEGILTESIDDIEITGNIYDHVYSQPVRQRR